MHPQASLVQAISSGEFPSSHMTLACAKWAKTNHHSISRQCISQFHEKTQFVFIMSDLKKNHSFSSSIPVFSIMGAFPQPLFKIQSGAPITVMTQSNTESIAYLSGQAVQGSVSKRAEDDFHFEMETERRDLGAPGGKRPPLLPHLRCRLGETRPQHRQCSAVVST